MPVKLNAHTATNRLGGLVLPLVTSMRHCTQHPSLSRRRTQHSHEHVHPLLACARVAGRALAVGSTRTLLKAGCDTDRRPSHGAEAAGSEIAGFLCSGEHGTHLAAIAATALLRVPSQLGSRG